MDTIAHKKADGTVLLSLDYDRYASGQIEYLTETRQGAAHPVKWHYFYDPQKRLTDAERDVVDGNPATKTTYSYAYDAAGNRTSKSIDNSPTATYVYNKLDQLISETSGGVTTTYEYDAYGNLAAKKQGAAVLDEYTWDCENHLVGATIRNTSGQLLRTLAFAYDGQGTRVRRTLTDAQTPANNAATEYLTDYMNPTGYSQTLQELDLGGGDVQAQYTYDDSGVLSQETAGGESSYFHGDHLGSTRLLTNATGNARDIAGLDYSPYGEPLAGTPSSLTSLAFTGQYRDSALGLQYHRARWLDPSTASWLSVDPVFDFPRNHGNLYSYAGLDPIGNTDLSGSFTLTECVVVAVIAVVIAICLAKVLIGPAKGALIGLFGAFGKYGRNVKYGGTPYKEEAEEEFQRILEVYEASCRNAVERGFKHSTPGNMQVSVDRIRGIFDDGGGTRLEGSCRDWQANTTSFLSSRLLGRSDKIKHWEWSRIQVYKGVFQHNAVIVYPKPSGPENENNVHNYGYVLDGWLEGPPTNRNEKFRYYPLGEWTSKYGVSSPANLDVRSERFNADSYDDTYIGG